MSLAVKRMIRIANEESNCLASFVNLTMYLITMLIKVPELECRPIFPTKAWKDFFFFFFFFFGGGGGGPKSKTFF